MQDEERKNRRLLLEEQSTAERGSTDPIERVRGILGTSCAQKREKISEIREIEKMRGNPQF